MKTTVTALVLVLGTIVSLGSGFVEAFSPTARRTANPSSPSSLQVLKKNADDVVLPTTTTTTTTTTSTVATPQMSPFESKVRQITMMSFVASMCLLLPLSLLPLVIMDKTNTSPPLPNLDKPRRQELALDIGQWCARFLLQIMPFMTITVDSDVVANSSSKDNDKNKNKKKQQQEENNNNVGPEPSIWVCNHTSMLDTFVLLAADLKLRGPNKRPIKVIYWKGLDENPICNLLFKLSGFIPVDMEANGSGVPNKYDKASFIRLLRQTKKAFEEGFDILVLPEGQLNPWPERGLLEVFPGAHKLSIMSHRPIHMVAMYGNDQLWSENPDYGMTVRAKDVSIRAYDHAKIFESGQEFVETFRTVVGHYGATGKDHPELESWLKGGAWKKKQAREVEIAVSKNVDAIEDAEDAIRTVLRREAHDEDILLDRKQDDSISNLVTVVGVQKCKLPPTTHALLEP